MSNLCDWIKLVRLNVDSLFNKLYGIISSKICKKLINMKFFAPNKMIKNNRRTNKYKKIIFDPNINKDDMERLKNAFLEPVCKRK